MGIAEGLQSLQAAWSQYWKDASDHWTCLIECFRTGGDWNALKVNCLERGVQDVVSRNLKELRAALVLIRSACSLLPYPIAGQLETLMSVLRAMLHDGDSDNNGAHGHITEPVSWDA